MDIANFIVYVSIFCLGFIFANLIVLTLGQPVIIQKQKVLENVTEAKKCVGSDIFFVSECLKNELVKFYKYNISNSGKVLSLNKFKIEGGVCSHATEWYLTELQGQGFYSDSVLINITNNTFHIVALMSNKDGYCILDQTEKGCVKFAMGNIFGGDNET